MVRIAAHSVTHHFGQNPSAARLCAFQFFQHQNAGAFADDESVALADPKDGMPAPGSSFRVESARIAANPPMPMGVTQASLPPQIITSASPR